MPTVGERGETATVAGDDPRAEVYGMKGSGVTIRTAHRSPREEAVRRELLGLLRRYDLRSWTFTGELVCDHAGLRESRGQA
jgi:hypothetical protein